MVPQQTATTRKLEGFARGQGLDVEIARVPSREPMKYSKQHSAKRTKGGDYYIVKRDGRALVRWIWLGKTGTEARRTLEEMAP